MFHIVTAVLMFIVTISFPPAAIITVPIALIWLANRVERKARARAGIAEIQRQRITGGWTS